MKGVHGPGPKRGSMDQGSMFCPLPDFQVTQNLGETAPLTRNISGCCMVLHSFGYV